MIFTDKCINALLELHSHPMSSLISHSCPYSFLCSYRGKSLTFTKYSMCIQSLGLCSFQVLYPICFFLSIATGQNHIQPNKTHHKHQFHVETTHDSRRNQLCDPMRHFVETEVHVPEHLVSLLLSSITRALEAASFCHKHLAQNLGHDLALD